MPTFASRWGMKGHILNTTAVENPHIKTSATHYRFSSMCVSPLHHSPKPGYMKEQRRETLRWIIHTPTQKSSLGPIQPTLEFTYLWWSLQRYCRSVFLFSLQWFKIQTKQLQHGNEIPWLFCSVSPIIMCKVNIKTLCFQREKKNSGSEYGVIVWFRAMELGLGLGLGLWS